MSLGIFCQKKLEILKHGAQIPEVVISVTPGKPISGLLAIQEDRSFIVLERILELSAVSQNISFFALVFGHLAIQWDGLI